MLPGSSGGFLSSSCTNTHWWNTASWRRDVFQPLESKQTQSKLCLPDLHANYVSCRFLNKTINSESFSRTRWYFHFLFFSPIRSLREGVAHMRREAFEKEEDEHQEEHAEPHLQRGHHLRHPPRQHGPRQPAHLRHGLRPVRTNHSHQSTGQWVGRWKPVACLLIYWLPQWLAAVQGLPPPC